MEFNATYFYTAAIRNWYNVISENGFEEIILNSLGFLSEKKLVVVYGFVIMPNHMHLIWEMLRKNGKEKPVASFMKYTAHLFLEKLRTKDQQLLKPYEVDWISRKHNFWQQDSLPVEICSERVFRQKLDYIHNNPLQEQWKLSETPETYPFSSAAFYSYGGKEYDFGFLKHYQE